ncbi:hypothetical protein Thermo_01693 [Thermoplasmatales archaeon]|nr:hypothetical protein Thermo_01693 [Thermoplasmatales archaeon]
MTVEENRFEETEIKKVQRRFQIPAMHPETDPDFFFDDRLSVKPGPNYDHIADSDYWSNRLGMKDRVARFNEYPEMSQIISADEPEEFVFLPEYRGWFSLREIIEDWELNGNLSCSIKNVEKGRIMDPGNGFF